MPAKNNKENNNNNTTVFRLRNNTNNILHFKQIAKQFFVFPSQQKSFDASVQIFRQIDALIANNSQGRNNAVILDLFRAGDKEEKPKPSNQSKSLLLSITDYYVTNSIGTNINRKQNTLVRLYAPYNGFSSSALSPLLIFVHGGGWISGNVKGDYDDVGKYLAISSGFKVASINYRLAPEHPFPAGLDDVVSAIRWIANSCKMLRIDCHRMALGGVSAGANLALSAALELTDLGQPNLLRAIYLLYGHYSANTDTGSYNLFGNGGYGETALDINFFMNQTFQKPADYKNPLAFPILAAADTSLARLLPPVYIVATSLDPLKDDSIELANLLQKSGHEYYLNIWPGLGHGVLNILSSIPEAKIYVDSMVTYLRGVLTNN
jgi:acetyl esterase